MSHLISLDQANFPQTPFLLLLPLDFPPTRNMPCAGFPEPSSSKRTSRSPTAIRQGIICSAPGQVKPNSANGEILGPNRLAPSLIGNSLKIQGVKEVTSHRSSNVSFTDRPHGTI